MLRDKLKKFESNSSSSPDMKKLQTSVESRLLSKYYLLNDELCRKCNSSI